MRLVPGSIKARLALASACVFTVSMLCVGLVGYRFASNAIIERIESESAVRASRLAAVTASEIGRAQATLRLLSRQRESRDLDWPAAAPYFEAARAEPGFSFEMIFLVREDGSGRATGGTEANLSDRDYFKAALSGDDEVVGRPLRSAVTGTLVAPLAAPIRDGGAVVGIVGATIGLESFSERLEEERVGRTGYGFLLDSSGFLIAHRDRAMLLSFNLLDSTEPGLADIGRRMTAGETGSGDYEFEGTIKTVSFAPVPGTDWSAGITIEREEILAPLAGLAKALLGAIVGFSVVMAVIVIAYLRRSFKPLDRLSRAFERLSAGDLAHRVGSSSGDEIGRIAATYDKVMDDLSSLIGTVKAASSASATLGTELAASSEETSAAVEEIEAAMSGMRVRVTSLSSAAENSDREIDAIRQAITGLNDQIARQAGAIAQSSSAVEEIVAGVASISRNAADKLDRSKDAADLSNRGEESVRETSEAIEEINRETVDMLETIRLINGIAGQTNLLAMNAAIEAAHAGEYGKGFSVVADEIRNLSDSTARHAKDIGAKLRSIADKVSQTATRDTEVSQLFSSIRNGVADVADGMEETLAGLKELAAGGTQIGQALLELKDSAASLSSSGTAIERRLDGIRKASEDVASIASENAFSISEIGSGLTQVSQSVAQLAIQSEQNARTIDSVELRLEGFTI